MDKIVAFLKSPLKVIGLGVVVVVLMLIGHFISARFNLFHDSKFDAGIQKKLSEADQKAGQVEEQTKQIQELTKKVDETNKKAEEIEKRDAALVQEVMLYKTAASAANQRSANAATKLANEDKRYAEEVEQSNSVNLSPCDRWLINCKRAIKLVAGFKGPCNCDQIPSTK